MTASATLLVPQTDKRLAKEITRDRLTGELRYSDCDRAWRLDAHAFPVPDLETLADATKVLAERPDCAAIRGALTPHAEAEVVAGNKIRRLKRDRGADLATVRDVSSPILMADIDCHPAEPHDPQHSPISVVVEAIAAHMPARFQDRTCWRQCSSTCGFRTGVGKFHIWFWLSEPRAGDELKAWAESEAPRPLPRALRRGRRQGNFGRGAYRRRQACHPGEAAVAEQHGLA